MKKDKDSSKHPSIGNMLNEFGLEVTNVEGMYVANSSDDIGRIAYKVEQDLFEVLRVIIKDFSKEIHGKDPEVIKGIYSINGYRLGIEFDAFLLLKSYALSIQEWWGRHKHDSVVVRESECTKCCGIGVWFYKAVPPLSTICPRCFGVDLSIHELDGKYGTVKELFDTFSPKKDFIKLSREVKNGIS